MNALLLNKICVSMQADQEKTKIRACALGTRLFLFQAPRSYPLAQRYLNDKARKGKCVGSLAAVLVTQPSLQIPNALTHHWITPTTVVGCLVAT